MQGIGMIILTLWWPFFKKKFHFFLPIWRLYKLNTLDLSLVWFEFGREYDYDISNNWKMKEAMGISEHSLNSNEVYPNFCLWKSKAQKYPTFL